MAIRRYESPSGRGFHRSVCSANRGRGERLRLGRLREATEHSSIGSGLNSRIDHAGRLPMSGVRERPDVKCDEAAGARTTSCLARFELVEPAVPRESRVHGVRTDGTPRLRRAGKNEEDVDRGAAEESTLWQQPGGSSAAKHARDRDIHRPTLIRVATHSPPLPLNDLPPTCACRIDTPLGGLEAGLRLT